MRQKGEKVASAAQEDSTMNIQDIYNIYKSTKN